MKHISSTTNQVVSRLYARNPKLFERFTTLLDIDLLNPRLSDAALRLYQIFKMYHFRYGDGCVFPSQDKLAEQTGQSERHIRRLLDGLQFAWGRRYDGSVGASVMRDLYGAMVHNRAREAFLVTTGTITMPARQWAANKPIHMIDGVTLVEWAKEQKEQSQGQKISSTYQQQ